MRWGGILGIEWEKNRRDFEASEEGMEEEVTGMGIEGGRWAE